jgi:hypothetical protein
MAPVDPLTTWRLKASYSGPFGRHTMLFHGELTDTSLDNLIGDVQDTIAQMVKLQYQGTTWDSAETAFPGGHFFSPLDTWEAITSTSGFDTTAQHAPSAFLNFCGRSITTGVRVKLYMFETYLFPVADMRYSTAENALVALVVGELNSADNEISAVDGTLVNWKLYANFGENDHLTHKARS